MSDDAHASSAATAFFAMLVVGAIALGLSALRYVPEPARTGDTVRAQITLTLDTGTVVYDDERTITLREGALVPGLLDAIVGMTPGSDRSVTIPPDRAYGARGRGDIPPDATLTAQIRLLDVLD